MKIKEQRLVNSDEFNQAMHIYKQSFPSHERASILEIQKRIHNKEEFLFTGNDGLQNANIIAFALFRPFKENRFILLDYFAVGELFRNQSKGSRFLLSILKDYASILSKNYDFILIEVDHPNFGLDKAENKIRERRIKFYRRIGGKLLENIHYLLPSFDPTSRSYSLAVEMQLMIVPLDHTKKPLQNLITKKLMQNVIRTLYFQLYHQKPDSDIVQTILSEVPNQINFVI
ncbi:MAG: hypothetical protein ACTSVU_04600 [Promethearchaeota archaeon]